MRTRGLRALAAGTIVLLTAASSLFVALPTGALSLDDVVPDFSHVFIIVGENTNYSQLTLANSPYLLGKLGPDSAWLTNYWATTHYSESNYVAMMSGQFTQCQQKDGKSTSCHQADTDNLFRQLATLPTPRSFLTWSESMPAPCTLFNTGSDAAGNHYAAKHNPQVFFDNVEGDAIDGPFVYNVATSQGGTYCQSNNIATGSSTVPNDMSGFNLALLGDSSAPAAIADFNLVVPNECEDAHDNCKPAGNPITQYDNFLHQEVPLIQDYINANGGVLIVTFDEGITNSPIRALKFGNGGNVAFAVWGPQVNPRVYPDGPYTHYSLLRTLEDGLGVDDALGANAYLVHASEAQPIAQIWKSG